MIEAGASREEVFAASVTETSVPTPRRCRYESIPAAGPGGPGRPGAPSEEELRAAYEAELAASRRST